MALFLVYLLCLSRCLSIGQNTIINKRSGDTQFIDKLYVFYMEFIDEILLGFPAVNHEYLRDIGSRGRRRLTWMLSTSLLLSDFF